MRPEHFALAATTNDLSREPAAREAADYVEFRMDGAADPLEQLARYDGELPVLATNRAERFGGETAEEGRLDHLLEASRFAFVELVDVELAVAREDPELLEEFRANDVELVVSHHDFKGTPDQDELDALVAECGTYGDVAKVATVPHSRSDALRVLNAVDTATTDGAPVAGIAMGELGSHTRVVAPLYGSRLGYAPLASDESEYAPGQIPLERLASLVEQLYECGSAASKGTTGRSGQSS